MSGRSRVSEQAQPYRQAMWLVSVLGMVGLVGAVGALRGTLQHAYGVIGLVAFAVCLVGAGWLGWKTHRQTVADREMESRRSMIVMLAVQLGRIDSPQLEGIAAKGGPAGEAAGLILQGRKEKNVRGEK